MGCLEIIETSLVYGDIQYIVVPILGNLEKAKNNYQSSNYDTLQLCGKKLSDSTWLEKKNPSQWL
jgi:hypothetical protein